MYLFIVVAQTQCFDMNHGVTSGTKLVEFWAKAYRAKTAVSCSLAFTVTASKCAHLYWLCLFSHRNTFRVYVANLILFGRLVQIPLQKNNSLIAAMSLCFTYQMANGFFRSKLYKFYKQAHKQTRLYIKLQKGSSENLSFCIVVSCNVWLIYVIIV